MWCVYATNHPNTFSTMLFEDDIIYPSTMIATTNIVPVWYLYSRSWEFNWWF